MSWIPQPTADGSFTFFSETFGETFHSLQGARSESFEKYATATHLAQRAANSPLRLLDVCYGLGYNTAAALEVIWSANPRCRVVVHGLELDGSVPLGAAVPALLGEWSPPVQQVLLDLAQSQHCQRERVAAHLGLGDARQTIQTLAATGFQADAIFFDPFSPRCCPELWTVEFFAQVGRCLAPQGVLATYSRSAAVRSAMRQVGFSIGSLPVGNLVNRRSHEWSQGTVAAWDPADLPPLSALEQEHLHTRAAVPYRDPQLSDPAKVIQARHDAEQQACGWESTSSWRRRWGIT